MSKIQEQIKALQRKQAIIDSYEEVRHGLKVDADQENEAGDIAKEVAEKLGKAIDREIAILMGDHPPQPVALPPTESVVPPPPKRIELDDMDPVRFLMKHRHFDNKLVKVTTEHGAVLGTVKGIDVPNLVVVTETGYTVHVPPSKCEIQNQKEKA